MKRQPYFSTPFPLQTRLSLCLIIVADSWALIKALHLTNNTNDVSSQKQMESSQSRTRRGYGNMNVFFMCFVLTEKKKKITG